MVTSMYSKVLQCGNLGVEKALFKAIFRAYNSRGKVFVPYPSSLHIVALQAHFANLIIISSTASVYLPCAISLLRKVSRALNMYRRSSAVRYR